MIVEIELAVIILLISPWTHLRQMWHKWAETKKLTAEHLAAEKVKQVIARESHNADV